MVTHGSYFIEQGGTGKGVLVLGVILHIARNVCVLEAPQTPYLFFVYVGLHNGAGIAANGGWWGWAIGRGWWVEGAHTSNL